MYMPENFNFWLVSNAYTIAVSLNKSKLHFHWNTNIRNSARSSVGSHCKILLPVHPFIYTHLFDFKRQEQYRKSKDN